MDHTSSSKSVLLVEGHPDVREVLHAALQFEGYEVIAAPSFTEALGMLEPGVELALVLLDEESSPETGMREVIHQLRRRPSFSTVPIVLLSMDRAHSTLDVQGLLRKPFTLEALLMAVKTSCR